MRIYFSQRTYDEILSKSKGGVSVETNIRDFIEQQGGGEFLRDANPVVVIVPSADDYSIISTINLRGD